jgi:hypothetical protein
MHKDNNGLIAKTKQYKYKKGLCFTEKSGCENALLFLYQPLVPSTKKKQQSKYL